MQGIFSWNTLPTFSQQKTSKNTTPPRKKGPEQSHHLKGRHQVAGIHSPKINIAATRRPSPKETDLPTLVLGGYVGSLEGNSNTVRKRRQRSHDHRGTVSPAEFIHCVGDDFADPDGSTVVWPLKGPNNGMIIYIIWVLATTTTATTRTTRTAAAAAAVTSTPNYKYNHHKRISRVLSAVRCSHPGTFWSGCCSWLPASF